MKPEKALLEFVKEEIKRFLLESNGVSTGGAGGTSKGGISGHSAGVSAGKGGNGSKGDGGKEDANNGDSFFDFNPKMIHDLPKRLNKGSK